LYSNNYLLIFFNAKFCQIAYEIAEKYSEKQLYLVHSGALIGIPSNDIPDWPPESYWQSLTDNGDL
jgi:hypothetical protein